MKNPTIKSFEQASSVLRSRQSRNLHGRSTDLVRVDDSLIAVRYHNTFIVKYFSDGTVQINSGGWASSLTTRKKIVEYAPHGFSVFQRDYEVYLRDYTGLVLPFQSGTILDADGKVIEYNDQPINAYFSALMKRARLDPNSDYDWRNDDNCYPFDTVVAEPETPVLFRIDDSDLFALFPCDPGTITSATCSCYMHMGQHGTAMLSECLKYSRAATPAEYKDLAEELTRIGYNLRVYETTEPWMRTQRIERLNRY